MNENESVNKVMNNFNRLLLSLYLFFYKKKRYILIMSDRRINLFQKKCFKFWFFKKK